jgi:hypothetical protein
MCAVENMYSPCKVVANLYRFSFRSSFPQNARDAPKPLIHADVPKPCQRKLFSIQVPVEVTGSFQFLVAPIDP